MLKRYIILIFVSAAILAACTNDDKQTKEDRSDALYADYKIWAEEGKESVDVLLQYRTGGPDGKAIAIAKPGTVSIDDIKLDADSAGISGVYYEAAFPLVDFSGDHLITLKDPVGKVHKHRFSFSAFTFSDDFPSTVIMEPFTFQLLGLPDSSNLRLVLTDTAFGTNDLNTEITAIKGQLTITNKMWRELKPGPVMLEIYKEEETEVSNFSKAGGIMTIHYGLKREFIALLPPKTFK